MNKENIFKIHTNCRFHKGYKTGIIYDLQRNHYLGVPNDLVDFVLNNEGLSKKECLKIYHENEIIIEEYFQFLDFHEYIHWGTKEEISWFPEYISDFLYPGNISSVVLYIGEGTVLSLDEIVRLQKSGCVAISLIFNAVPNIDFAINFFNVMESYPFEHIELNIQNNLMFFDFIDQLNTKVYFHLRIFIEHEFEKNKYVFKKEDFNVVYEKGLIKPREVSKKSFRINNLFYNESLIHNVYFNMKLFLNEEKICMHSGQKLSQIDLDTYQNPYSRIDKHHTLICRDCEHRFMCVDSRIPQKSTIKTLWTYDHECNYNPYVSKWKNEIGYQTIAESISTGLVDYKFMNRPIDD